MDKKKKKSSPIGFAVIALVFIAQIVSEAGGGPAGTAAVIMIAILCAVVAAVVWMGKKVGTEQEKTGNTAVRTAQTPARTAQTPVRTQARTYSTTIAYTPKSEKFERYANQLKGFLKSGIIDRSEYNYLMEKYRRELSN